VKYDGMIVMCQGMSLFFGRLFVIRFALCYRPLLCPVCDIGVLWPNGWMDQNETWHGGRPRPRPHCVRWGPSSLPKRGTAPNFRPVRQATVLDGDPAPPTKKGAQPPPNFRPMSIVAKWSPTSATTELLFITMAMCIVYCGSLRSAVQPRSSTEGAPIATVS